MATHPSILRLHLGCAAAAWLVLACAGRPARAQQAPTPQTPQPQPASPQPAGQRPPPETPATSNPPGQPLPEYKGLPSEASAGGSEYRIPDRAGLLPNGPISLIDDPLREVGKWASENLRLDLGARAAFGFQQASAGPGERTAASQDYRVYGTWHAFNWEEEKKGWAGNVYARFEWRAEMFTKIPPFQLNTQIGTLFTTTYSQDEHDPAVVQLYYEQFLFDGGLRLRVGKIDPDDYFNLGRWADDYRYFDNALFSAFPASNHPSGGLGFNAQWYIVPEKLTLTGGLSDVQGRKTMAGFNTIDEGKFFYGLDLTYSPTIPGWGKGNYRVGIEYRDSVPDKDKPEDTTVYFNIDQEIVKDIAPFFRYSHGTGNSTGVENVVSVGIGVDNAFNHQGDAAGIGFGFNTAADSVDSPRSTEYASELFYRLQLTRAMQFTVGGQLILNPILAPDDDAVGIFEMRLVIDF